MLIDPAKLALFIPTFFFISITPGMCMTLALTLGMQVGVRTTMWMMWGELLGVATVAIAAAIGVSAILLKFPQIFLVIKIAGGAYLVWVGLNMWANKGKLALQPNQQLITSKRQLFTQGYVTAIANPKGWAFMLSLLPPFINPELPFASQLSVLIVIILASEFICMMLYASGGKTLGRIINKNENVMLINKISGSLMIGVAIWLMLS